MSAIAFDWDSVPTGDVHADGIDYRWKRGEVHIVLATELPELLVFIDRLTLTLLDSAEIHDLVAVLQGTAGSAFLADDLEIREGITGGLSIGGELDTVEIGLTDQEVANVIEGLTAMLPHMEAVEQTDVELANSEEQ